MMRVILIAAALLMGWTQVPGIGAAAESGSIYSSNRVAADTQENIPEKIQTNATNHVLGLVSIPDSEDEASSQTSGCTKTTITDENGVVTTTITKTSCEPTPCKDKATAPTKNRVNLARPVQRTARPKSLARSDPAGLTTVSKSAPTSLTRTVTTTTTSSSCAPKNCEAKPTNCNAKPSSVVQESGAATTFGLVSAQPATANRTSIWATGHAETEDLNADERAEMMALIRELKAENRALMQALESHNAQKRANRAQHGADARQVETQRSLKNVQERFVEQEAQMRAAANLLRAGQQEVQEQLEAQRHAAVQEAQNYWHTAMQRNQKEIAGLQGKITKLTETHSDLASKKKRKAIENEIRSLEKVLRTLGETQDKNAHQLNKRMERSHNRFDQDAEKAARRFELRVEQLENRHEQQMEEQKNRLEEAYEREQERAQSHEERSESHSRAIEEHVAELEEWLEENHGEISEELGHSEETVEHLVESIANDLDTLFEDANEQLEGHFELHADQFEGFADQLESALEDAFEGCDESIEVNVAELLENLQDEIGPDIIRSLEDLTGSISIDVRMGAGDGFQNRFFFDSQDRSPESCESGVDADCEGSKDCESSDPSKSANIFWLDTDGSLEHLESDDQNSTFWVDVANSTDRSNAKGRFFANIAKDCDCECHGECPPAEAKVGSSFFVDPSLVTPGKVPQGFLQPRKGIDTSFPMKSDPSKDCTHSGVKIYTQGGNVIFENSATGACTIIDTDCCEQGDACCEEDSDSCDPSEACETECEESTEEIECEETLEEIAPRLPKTPVAPASPTKTLEPIEPLRKIDPFGMIPTRQNLQLASLSGNNPALLAPLKRQVILQEVDQLLEEMHEEMTLLQRNLAEIRAAVNEQAIPTVPQTRTSNGNEIGRAAKAKNSCSDNNAAKKAAKKASKCEEKKASACEQTVKS